MLCPKCRNGDSKVLETRTAKTHSIRRRRECLACGARFSTIEEILSEEIYVKKRDGKREEFNLAKITKAIEKATAKRNITLEQIENMASQIVRELQEACDSEIPTKLIGEKIMEKLSIVDKIAYVRFACVYKDFQDIKELRKDINSLDK